MKGKSILESAGLIVARMQVRYKAQCKSWVIWQILAAAGPLSEEHIYEPPELGDGIGLG